VVIVELNTSQKQSAIFGGAFILAGIVIATVVFPFWNLIREDVYEDVEILSNENQVCYVETQDIIPKTIKNCTAEPGSTVTIKFGEGLAWAEIVDP